MQELQILKVNIYWLLSSKVNMEVYKNEALNMLYKYLKKH